jgi:hypothetical protein
MRSLNQLLEVVNKRVLLKSEKQTDGPFLSDLINNLQKRPDAYFGYKFVIRVYP